MNGREDADHWLAALRASLRALPPEPLPRPRAAALRGELARQARRRASIESVLAAYADGELNPAQRRIVEERLLPRPEARQALEELQALHGLLAAEPVPAPVPEAAAAAAHALAAVRGERPQAHPQEMLSACLDGEANRAEVARMNAVLKCSRSARRTARAWRQAGAALAALPRVAAPPDLLAKTLEQLRAGEPAFPPPKSVLPAPAARSWRAPAWGLALGVAGVGVWLAFGPGGRTPESAQAPLPAPLEVAKVEPRASADGLRNPEPKRGGFVGPAPRAPGMAEPWVDDPPPAPRELAGPPPEPVAKRVEDLLRPGQVVGGGRVEFHCLSVQRMHDRLHAMFLRHHVAVRADGEAADPAALPGDRIVRIAIEASPEQLQQLLASLRSAEARDHLVAGLEVRPPETVNLSAMKVLPPNAPAPAPPKPAPPAVAMAAAEAPRQVLFVLRAAPRLPVPLPMAK